jgi:hypothetical protein
MSHFPAVLLFSLFVSVVFGITQRSQPKQMAQFGSICFGLMVLLVIAASWLMALIRR